MLTDSTSSQALPRPRHTGPGTATIDAMIRAFHADGLLDPAIGETVSEAVVLVERGRIRAAGRRASISVPSDAEGSRPRD
jgi:hypothetical protein